MTDTALRALHAQLDRQIDPYLRIALARGDPLQVILYVGRDGEVGDPKVTTTPKGEEKK